MLPGLEPLTAILLLFLAGLCMAVIASVAGFVPALVATFFAPLVVALTDPMWTLGTSIADFTLANESLWTFATFALASAAGAAFSTWKGRQRSRRTGGLWRAHPARKSSASRRII
jgi:hypothetical protein